MDAGNKLPIIKFLTGPLAGRTFVISKPVTTIGRDASNDIVVPNDQRVSRQHARLLWQSGTWRIENVSQRAHLTVDQRDTQQALIGDNTVIALGADTSFVFLVQAEIPTKQSGGQGAPTTFRSPTGGGMESLPAAKQVFPTPPPPISTTALGGTPIQALRPDHTQIASVTALGLPSLELSGNGYSDKKAYILRKPTIN